MPNPREKLVTIHHPKLRAEQTVRQRQADVLAASGWKAGSLSKTKTDKE
jgi:hypothetical protein